MPKLSTETKQNTIFKSKGLPEKSFFPPENVSILKKVWLSQVVSAVETVLPTRDSSSLSRCRILWRLRQREGLQRRLRPLRASRTYRLPGNDMRPPSRRSICLPWVSTWKMTLSLFGKSVGFVFHRVTQRCRAYFPGKQLDTKNNFFIAIYYYCCYTIQTNYFFISDSESFKFLSGWLQCLRESGVWVKMGRNGDRDRVL